MSNWCPQPFLGASPCRGCFGQHSRRQWLLRPTSGAAMAPHCQDDSQQFNRIWFKKNCAWREKVLLDPCQPSLGSWLEGAGKRTELAVGCKACFAHGSNNPWGKYKVCSPSTLQLYCLQRRSTSLRHIVAVQKLLRRSLPDAAIDHVSPSADEFKRLIDNIHGSKLKVSDRKPLKNFGACGKRSKCWTRQRCVEPLLFFRLGMEEIAACWCDSKLSPRT